MRPPAAVQPLPERCTIICIHTTDNDSSTTRNLAAVLLLFFPSNVNADAKFPTAMQIHITVLKSASVNDPLQRIFSGASG